MLLLYIADIRLLYKPTFFFIMSSIGPEQPRLSGSAESIKQISPNKTSTSQKSSVSSTSNGRTFSQVSNSGSDTQKTAQKTTNTFTAGNIGASQKRRVGAGISSIFKAGTVSLLTNVIYYSGYAVVKSIVSSAGKSINEASVRFGFTKESENIKTAKCDLGELAKLDANSLHNSEIGKNQIKTFEENIIFQ